MKNLRKIGSYPTGQCLCSFRQGFLVKTETELSYYEGKRKVRDILSCSMYGRKLILSPTGDLAFLQNGLLSSEGFFFRPSIPTRKSWIEIDAATVLLDCCFAEDGTFYFLVREEGDTSLRKIKDGRQEIILKLTSKDDRIGFSKQWNALILFDRRGHFAVISEGQIRYEFVRNGAHKVYPYREGNLLLSDSPRGFLLLNRSGKVLKRMDFLLASETPERIVDFVLLEEKDRIFVLTKREERTNLYVFGAKDFALKEALLERKKEVDGIATDGRFVSLKSRFGIELYSVPESSDGN